MDQQFDFEEYSGKVVGEKQANNNLKRKISKINSYMAAIAASSILSLAACAYVEVEKNSEQEATVEGVTETGGIPFSEERIKEFEGNVVIKNPEALENAYKKDLTQTQVIVKKAIDNALRINGLIGKNGLSANELEQVIKNSEAERAGLKEKMEGTMEVPENDTDLEYWKLEDTTYVGIDPPKDTATSIWIPTGEQTPYQELGNGVYKSDPTWRQVSLELDKVMHHMSYADACSINAESESIDFIPVYATVESAIQKRNPWQERKEYLEFLDAKIGKAHALIAGIYVPIEKVDGVSSFDSISFSLEKTNSEGKTKTVGYVNGNDLIASLARNMADIFQEEETNTQENVPNSPLQP